MRAGRSIIKQEFFEMLGDDRLALILNQFLYWTDRVKDIEGYITEERERWKDVREIKLESGWIYKSAEAMIGELMISVSRKGMNRFLSILCKRGYLFRRRNPLNKRDRTWQYRVNLLKVVDDLEARNYRLEGFRHLLNKGIDFVKIRPLTAEETDSICDYDFLPPGDQELVRVAVACRRIWGGCVRK